jgi:hypothetical protein
MSVQQLLASKALPLGWPSYGSAAERVQVAGGYAKTSDNVEHGSRGARSPPKLDVILRA